VKRKKKRLKRKKNGAQAFLPESSLTTEHGHSCPCLSSNLLFNHQSPIESGKNLGGDSRLPHPLLFCVLGGEGREELLGGVNGNLSRAEVIDIPGDDAVRFRLKRRFMEYRILEIGHAAAN